MTSEEFVVRFSALEKRLLAIAEELEKRKEPVPAHPLHLVKEDDDG
jgi:hypothetical protein